MRPKKKKNLLRLSNLYLRDEYEDKGCPKGNWVCKNQYGSEWSEDQNSKLWIVNGYCVPNSCKRNSDCLVGDFCNGGSTDGGVCWLEEENGYLIAKCVK